MASPERKIVLHTTTSLDFAGRGLESFTCPQCGRTSFNADDVAERYCGACHDWTGLPGPAAVDAAIESVRAAASAEYQATRLRLPADEIEWAARCYEQQARSGASERF